MPKKIYENNPFNIVGCYFSASTEEKVAGLNWYPNAKAIASRIGDIVNIRDEIVEGVIAALSPNVRWERNCKDAETLLTAMVSSQSDSTDWRETRLSAYPLNREKACKILSVTYFGMGPDLIDNIRNILNGNKTKAFFQCINDPANPTAVCVDGHARNIFYGSRVALKSKSMGDNEYNHIANAYREAADIISKAEERKVLPMEVQAVTWTHWRVRHGIA